MPEDPHAPIDQLAARRRKREASANPPLEDPRLVEMLEEQGLAVPDVERAALARAWEAAVAEHGVSLASPEGEAYARGIADFLDRLAHGAMIVRDGDPARGIGPNPDDGMDRVSARMLVGLARDLRDTPAILRASQP
jgi:hypothetical protein